MVNGCVTHSIDFLIQTAGLVHAAAVTHSLMWILTKSIDLWMSFCSTIHNLIQRSIYFVRPVNNMYSPLKSIDLWVCSVQT